jgi:hypothetical protein
MVKRSLSNFWITKDRVDVEGIADTVHTSGRLGLTILNKARKLLIERSKIEASGNLSIARHQQKITEQRLKLALLEEKLEKLSLTSSSIHTSLITKLHDIDTPTNRHTSLQDLDDLDKSIKNLPVNPFKEQVSEIFKTWKGFKHKLVQILNLVTDKKKRYKKTLITFTSYEHLLGLLLNPQAQSPAYAKIVKDYSNSLNTKDQYTLTQCLSTLTFFDKDVWSILYGFVDYARSQIFSPLSKIKQELVSNKLDLYSQNVELTVLKSTLKEKNTDYVWTKKMFDLTQYSEKHTLSSSICMLGLAQELGHPDFPKHFSDVCFIYLKNLNPESVGFIKEYALNEIHGTVKQTHFDTVGATYCVNAR